MPVRNHIAASCAHLGAIAGLVLRAALRSRLFACMAVLLLLLTTALPLTIAGDGSLTAQINIQLNAALGAATLCLGVAMLWTSCAGVSRELESGSLCLVAVRPVYPLEIWLGKWLGLLALSSMLLAVAGLGAGAMLLWQWNHASADAVERQALRERVLTSQRRIPTRAEDVTAAAEAHLAELTAAGLPTGQLPRVRALEWITRQIRAQRSAVAVGASRAWIVDLPPNLPPDAALSLRVRFSPSSGDYTPLSGAWTIHAGPGAGPPLETKLTDYRNGTARLPLPAGFARPGQSLHVTYTNTPGPNGGTVLFDIDAGIELLMHAGGFAPNLLRALLIIWCRLALLCAIGLAAGTWFSFPVASFFASALVLLSLTGHFFVSDQLPAFMTNATQAASSAGTLQRLSESMIRALEVVAAPAVADAPLALVADGIRVPWSRVAQSLLTLVGFYGGLLALVSATLLRRRELAAVRA